MRPPTRVLLNVGEFYTLQGAAKALGLSYWTIYRYVRVAGIPTRRLSNLVLVRLEDLRELAHPIAQAEPNEAATMRVVGRFGPEPEREPDYSPRAKRCPECGEATLVYEEGCQKCYCCGYSRC